MTFTKAVWMVVIASAAAFVAHGQEQSVADVARASRQKTTLVKTAGATPKVITNEDIPEAQDSSATSENDTPVRSPHHDAASEGKKSAAEWKSEIQAQKNQVDALQQRIDRENSSIHFVEASRYYYGVQHNERQVRKQEDVERLRDQLEQEKKTLESMQEGARQQGYGNSVYEP